MEINSIYTVIVTVISILGSQSAWNYYRERSLSKQRKENYIKDDCRDRISKLEQYLTDSSQEKERMRVSILELSTQVGELRVKLEFIERENQILTARNEALSHIIEDLK